jgi:16S rRNA U516 pseudouridylate synthase RsuA-like enzyme
MEVHDMTRDSDRRNSGEDHETQREYLARVSGPPTARALAHYTAELAALDRTAPAMPPPRMTPEPGMTEEEWILSIISAP